MTPEEIVAFWEAVGKDRWYKADPEFDAELRQKFIGVYDTAAAGELEDWRQTATGSLALVLVLDQFSRNMFRGTPKAFAADAKALSIANGSIVKGFDKKALHELRAFFYMPFMHSEMLVDQDRCVWLMQEHGGDDNIKYAEIHRDIIRRFGRFPHRNEILGRNSTAEEITFLKEGGFSG